jgi:hypothetical protein
MRDDYLERFRRQLYEWLQLRLTAGGLPFRRVEETPQLTVTAAAPPADLVLWINRDSLLAGAVILVPARVEAALLEQGATLARSLGLRHFVTWGSRNVDIWAVDGAAPRSLQSWPVPAGGEASAAAFAAIFEQLLQTLKNQVVQAMLPPEQLPPEYFANLCRLAVRDIEPALQETARVAARPGDADAGAIRRAQHKGWLSVWRLLALLKDDRMPPGIVPERLERALGYALNALPPAQLRHLRFENEPPLPESAAVRLYHLAGRLSQLGWPQLPQRRQTTFERLLAETAHDCQVDLSPLPISLRAGDLLVNHLPPQLPAGSLLVAPRPCLAGLTLAAEAAGTPLPEWLGHDLALLPPGARPEQILASLHDSHPFPVAERRARTAALRQPWPYRRFPSASGPAWLWEALYLGGVVDPDGMLRLTLPPGWPTAPGAEWLWTALTERLSPAGLQLHDQGQQTLALVGHHRAPDTVPVHHPDGTIHPLPSGAGQVELGLLAALSSGSSPSSENTARRRRNAPRLAEMIGDKVFRDGIPKFPEDYLRRHEATPLRRYRLPGALRPEAEFFGQVRLTSQAGETVEADNPAAAEAIQLASCSGRASVELPLDPQLTAGLVAAYRRDLHTLWCALIEECRRHHASRSQALALANRLWRQRQLPAPESG